MEKALREHFLPALLAEESISDTQRDILSLPVKFAGLSIPNPAVSADGKFRDSAGASADLVRILRGQGGSLNVKEFTADIRKHRRASRAARDETLELDYQLATESLPARDKKRMDRARSAGAWLTVKPDRLNGTELSRGEFQDNVRLRYGLNPVDLPKKCDGCGHNFTADHALTCAHGGKVLL